VQRAGAVGSTTDERIGLQKQAAIEFLMNALRLLDGTPVAAFVARAGQPVEAIAAARDAAVERGWLTAELSMLRATPSGIERLNRLLELFA
jgi:oxygen-independent coproporphyrinogen-3 oxidase